MPSKTDIPPVDIHTEYDEEGRGELSVYAAIQQPDGNHVGATETTDPDATPGQVAAALARVVTGLAAAVGPEMAEQMSMRIVDPDQPAFNPASAVTGMQAAKPTGGISVTMLDRWAAEMRPRLAPGQPLLIRVGEGRAIPFDDARALLVLAGAL